MRHILLFVSMTLALFSQAQRWNPTANISGTSSSSVIGSGFYNVTEVIYTNAEIGEKFIAPATAIEKIGFGVASIPSNPADVPVNNFKIYMKNVSPSQTTFPFSSAYSTTDYTLVFEGTFNPTTFGNYDVTLTTPFVRQFGTNLQILIERTDSVKHPGYLFFNANGNSLNAVAFSARTYNGDGAPVSGVTALTQTFKRPLISLYHGFTDDAGIGEIVSPTTTSCFNTSQDMKVVLTNDGINPINPGAVQVTLKIGGANSFTGTATNTGSIVSGSTETITFSGVNLDNPGANFDTAFISMAGDLSVYNDTLKATHQSATTFPYTVAVDTTLDVKEDVESSGVAPVFPFVQLLQEGVETRSQLWTIQNGVLADNGMGMEIGPYIGSTGSKYFMYNPFLFEGANSEGDISLLYSNCIDLPPTSPTRKTYVTFNMTHDSNLDAFADSIYVVISDDRGQSWNVVGSFARVNMLLPTTDITWSTEEIEIPASYEGKVVQIGFKAVGYAGNTIGLDDINILTRPTPVKMISFDARRSSGTTVDLTWNVTTESGMDNYVIERSGDGKNYVAIGSVVAQNTNLTSKYSFTDANLLHGNNYYRLRMVSKNSSVEYSQVRMIRIADNTEMVVYPNPVQSVLSVYFESEKNESITLQVADMNGRVILSQKANVTQGGSRVDIPAQSLNKGTYIITTTLNGIRLAKRISKL